MQGSSDQLVRRVSQDLLGLRTEVEKLSPAGREVRGLDEGDRGDLLDDRPESQLGLPERLLGLLSGRHVDKQPLEH